MPQASLFQSEAKIEVIDMKISQLASFWSENFWNWEMAYFLFLDSCVSYDEFGQKCTPLYYVKRYSFESKWAFIWLLSLHIIEGYVFDWFIKTSTYIVWKSKKTNIQKPQFETLIRISFKLFEHLFLSRIWWLRRSFFYHVLGRTSLLRFSRQNCLLNVWNPGKLHHYHPDEYILVNRTDFTDLHRQRLAFRQPFFAEAIITVTYIIT